MGVTKSELFTTAQNEIALAAKAFAHPARVAIILHLLKARECINSDLVCELGLAQPTISQHLRELKDAGILQGNIEGTKINYCINSQRWKELRSIFNSIFDQLSETPNNCC